MSFDWPKSGPNNVPAYQMSGIPFVTSSLPSEVPGPDANSVSLPVRIDFPFVTKFITVRNTGINALRVGFTADGVVAPGERKASKNEDKVGTDNTSQAPNSYGGRNYFIIPTGSANTGFGESTQTFELRCKSIFFLSDAGEENSPGAAQATGFSLAAGLTNIFSDEFPVLTGSNGFQGVG